MTGPRGLMIGIVQNRDDPDGLGRVQVSLPVAADELTTDWVPVATLFAGRSVGQHGSCFLPQVGDEVILGFLDGDLDHAVVLGSLYNGVDKPALAAERQLDTDELRTTAQSRLTFTNTEGAATIELADRNGNGLTIAVEDESITISAKSKITISTEGELNLKGETVSIEATSSLSASGSTSMTLDGGGELSARAGLIKLN